MRAFDAALARFLDTPRIKFIMPASPTPAGGNGLYDTELADLDDGSADWTASRLMCTSSARRGLLDGWLSALRHNLAAVLAGFA
jgi:hypothetical protein